jgi:hypothetical protein
MRFVLVNGRTPRPQSFCVECCEPIGASYLREFGMQQSYCDYDCYALHCGKAAVLLEHLCEGNNPATSEAIDRHHFVPV